MYQRNSHCSYCGHPFQPEHPWPRTCDSCQHTSFLNPLPVAVVLLPVDDGLLVVRRSIEPRKGELSLPGGYIGLGESWQAAAARELFEETGVVIAPAELQEFRVLSPPDGIFLLVFGLAQPRHHADLPPFVPNAEASEALVLRGPEPLAFPLHTQAMQEFFARRGPSR